MKISLERIELLLTRCQENHIHPPLSWDESWWLVKEIKKLKSGISRAMKKFQQDDGWEKGMDILDDLRRGK